MNTSKITQTINSTESIKYWNEISRICLEPVKIQGDFEAELSLWYQKVITCADALIRNWEKTAGISHTCSPGCSSCCYQLVEIYDFELVAILNYVENNGLGHILENAVEIAETIEQQLNGKSLENNTPNEELLKNRLFYRSLSIPCMFLKDNKCLIYPVRPTSCANYHSYGPIEACDLKENIPAYCKSFSPIEDWIAKQITAFLEYNSSSIPRYLDPFNLRFMPVAIRDYLCDY